MYADIEEIRSKGLGVSLCGSAVDAPLAAPIGGLVNSANSSLQQDPTTTTSGTTTTEEPSTSPS